MASHRRARKELGHYDKADEIVKAAKFYLVREDGLKERWHGRIWANPPYGGHTGEGVDQMHWQLSYRTDPLIKPLADRHYNRQNPESPNFVPPGRCVVLRTADCDAFWVTLAPFAEYVQHAWAGAWTCTAFRNEGKLLSSVLIRQAVAATLFLLKKPPTNGFITFVDSRRIKSANPGCCFKKAGWELVGYTQKARLHALQLAPEAFPAPEPPLNCQFVFWD